MAEEKKSPKGRYRVRNTFPGKVFSKTEQQRIATQISNQLALHKGSKMPVKSEAQNNPENVT